VKAEVFLQRCSVVSDGDVPILEMRDIRKTFPGVVALDGVTIEARLGEVHAIVGENGAGKSTLMKILSGAYPEYEGGIFLDGELLSLPTPRAAENAGIATIYQELNLVPHLTVAENIFLGREFISRFRTIDGRRMHTESARLLSLLDSDIAHDVSVKELRIGEQQLVEVAKSLSLDARILIMDEPTSALSDHEVQKLFQIIRSMKERGMAILYISHKMDEVFTIADRITVLRDGNLVGSRRREETSPDEIVTMMVGREISDMFPREKREHGDEVLSVEGLATEDPNRPGERFLDDISFVVRCGEIVGLAGLMGSGRSEILEALFGSPRTRILEGEVAVEGSLRKIKSPIDAIDSGMALVTEDRKTSGLFSQLSLGQNISMSCLKEVSIALGWISSGSEKQTTEEYIGKLDIKPPRIDTLIDNLSGGNQQKAILARCLLTSPKVLLLDDPTRGVDVGAKNELYRLMNALAGQGIGVLMASSELPEIIALCDRILVLSSGKLVGELRHDEATEEKIMKMATGATGSLLEERRSDVE